MDEFTRDELILPDWPAPPHVRACVTTVAFGNLAPHVGNDPQQALTNRMRLRAQCPVEPLWLTQVHGTRCVDVDVSEGEEADASFSRRRGSVCAVLTADCLPVLLCDKAGTVVAAAHAGWRGLADGVLEATVAAMKVPAQDLMAWLGPAIGPASFEVGAEVRTAFMKVDPTTAEAFTAGHSTDKWWCDLYALARRRLNAGGVSSLWGGGRCTFAEPEHFYSFRRDNVGRMASLIWLK
ncbi:MAG: peptidoglycan editing factor PgeF [Rhodocyclaceae bacterium]|nr:peptidoglycan editing factor PgeF [Rhodocyclaceae bacterium]